MSVALKPKRRIMRSFKLNEISAVDIPAQQGALATLMKSATPRVRLNKPVEKIYTTEPRPIVQSIMKYYGGWVDPANGAVSFSTVLDCYEQNDKYQRVVQETGPLVSALDTSIRSIIADKAVEVGAKQTLMRSAVEEFLAAIKGKWPDVEEELAKSLATLISGDGPSSQEEKNMNKTAKELSAEIAKLQKMLAEMGDDPVAKMTALETENAALKKQVEDATKAATEAAEKAKKIDPTDDKKDLDEAEASYATTMDAKAKKEFMAMTPAERKKKMSAKKSTDGDETIEVAGQTVSKASVGDAAFAVFKAMANETEELRKSNKDLSKAFLAEQEKNEMAGFMKRADEEMSHLPGTPEEKAKALKSIASLPEGVRGPLEKMLIVGDKAVSKAYATVGTKGGSVNPLEKNDNGASFEKRVKEIQKRDAIPEVEAMTKARQEFPEEFDAYQNADA